MSGNGCYHNPYSTRSRTGRPSGSQPALSAREIPVQGVGLVGGVVEVVGVLVVGVEVGVVVVVGVAVGVGVVVVVGVGVGELCPVVGWYWAKLDVAALGETVGELDLLGCADADAETLELGDGGVVLECPLACVLRAVAAEADAATITAAAPAATQNSRRRFLRCGGGPAAPPSTPPESAAATGPVGAADGSPDVCVGGVVRMPAGCGGWPDVLVGDPGGAEPPTVSAGGGESWVPKPAAASRPDGRYRPTTSVIGGGSQSAARWPSPSSARTSPGVGR